MWIGELIWLFSFSDVGGDEKEWVDLERRSRTMLNLWHFRFHFALQNQKLAEVEPQFRAQVNIFLPAEAQLAVEGGQWQ